MGKAGAALLGNFGQRASAHTRTNARTHAGMHARRARAVALAALVCLAVVVQAAARSVPLRPRAPQSTWECVPLAVVQVTPAVLWERENCTGTTPAGRVGPLVFNIVRADLSDAHVRVRAARADPAHNPPLQDVRTIAQSVPRAVAAVNGGFFWRVDERVFFDNVCFFKSRADAERNASAEHPNYGLGDGLTLIDGELVSSNCDCLGYDRPTALIVNGTESYVSIMRRAERAPPGTRDAIAAGPNLVSYDAATGAPVFDIPADDHNVNILEHTTNTAVGVVRGPSCNGRAQGCTNASLVLVTCDGYDGCPRADPTCGVNAHEFAWYMLDRVHATEAMQMDQGGSTTMFVRGQGDNSIVSNPGHGLRSVFNALVITDDRLPGERE